MGNGIIFPLLIYRNEYSTQYLHIKCARNVLFCLFVWAGGLISFYLFLSRKFAVDVGTGSS